MRECFWSIYKFRTYIQLGKNYTLYVVKKNKEGQWIEKKIINFLPLLRLSPYRCKKCGRKLIREDNPYDSWIDGYGVYLCPKCDNLEV